MNDVMFYKIRCLGEKNVMELIQQYQLYLLHQRKSNETIRSYLNTCRQFIAFLKHEFGISTFQKVDNTVSCKYLQHLKEVKRNTGATINVKIYALRSFFAYLVQEKHVSTNPFESVAKESIIERRVEVLSEEELAVFIDAVTHPLVKNILYTLMYTGIRINECLGLIISDIDFQRNQLIIRNGKGKHVRKLPLHEELKKRLMVHISSLDTTQKQLDTFLFPISAAYVNKIMALTVKKLAWSQRITCHTFRHSFATNLVKKGVNVPTVAELLGHKDYRVVTKTYIHLDEEVMSDAIHLLT